jgi:trimeric autotransporter adhesin
MVIYYISSKKDIAMQSKNTQMKTSKAKIAPPVNRLRTKFLFALLLSTFFTVSLFAQSPAAFNFQAVARNAGGVAINNTTVGVQFQLHQTSTYGTVVYAETHAPITNEFGLFTVQVGNGTPSIGTLSAVNWNAGPYFLEISIDPAGGTSYTSMGSGQLFSVPYALASGSSGFWGTNGIDINNTNSGRIGIGTSTPGTVANTNAKIEIADENGLNSGILMRTASGGVPVITLAKQEGILANPSAVDPDAEVGALEATYYNGLAYGVSSSIRMSAGYSDGTDYPGVIEVQTTPAGSSAPMTRILINETGNVGIGTETPARILDVNGDALIHGLTIGKGNGEEPTNSVIGIDALISITSGTNNTAVGASALLANTAGYSNTATGVNALNSNTEGGRNTATGVSALYYNSTGFNNTAVGLKALWSNSTASWNTAIGIESALSKAGPDIITVVGARALSNATNGPNTALGYNAGHETTTGTHNVAAGGNALFNNT